MLLGFQVNTKTDLKEVIEKPPRLRQLTLQEFLQLPLSRKNLTHRRGLG